MHDTTTTPTPPAAGAPGGALSEAEVARLRPTDTPERYNWPGERSHVSVGELRALCDAHEALRAQLAAEQAARAEAERERGEAREERDGYHSELTWIRVALDAHDKTGVALASQVATVVGLLAGTQAGAERMRAELSYANADRDRLASELAAARGALARVVGVFDLYAGLHRAKGTPEGERKAAENAAHAERCRAVLERGAEYADEIADQGTSMHDDDGDALRALAGEWTALREDAERWREVVKHLRAHPGAGPSTHVEAWLSVPYARSVVEAVDRLREVNRG